MKLNRVRFYAVCNPQCVRDQQHFLSPENLTLFSGVICTLVQEILLAESPVGAISFEFQGNKLNFKALFFSAGFLRKT